MYYNSYVEFITSTELRTKTKDLIKALNSNEKVKLLHRSKVIGVISPLQEEAPPQKPKTLGGLIKAFERLREKYPEFANAIPESYEERDRLYRERIMKKYGKGLS